MSYKPTNPLTIDFETYDARILSHHQKSQKEEDDALHNMRNFDAIRRRLGEARTEEIHTALVLALGPPSPPHHVQTGRSPARGLIEFRAVLETATGIPFSLAEALPWYKEHWRWFEDQKTRLCITTTARK